MPLSDTIKRILNGLAYAHVGDYLTPAQKDAALAGLPPVSRVQAGGAPPVLTGADIARSPGEGPRIGLYLGGELPGELMQYVQRTCGRLGYGLTVLTLQTRKAAQALLAPYEDELAQAGIVPRLVCLANDPSRALAQALRRRPEIAFLVCNESGYLGRGLLNGGQHVMPIPVVLVSPSGTLADAPVAGQEPASRAA